MDNKTDNVRLSVVLGSYNRRRFLKATIQSIRDNGMSVPYEIIVVDGGSTDGSLGWLSRQKDIITIVQHNQGSFRGKPIQRRSWGYFMNLALRCAQGKFIVMISDDVLLIPGSIMNGLNYFEDLTLQGRTIGAVAYYFRNWPEQQKYFVRTTLGHKLAVNHGMFLRSALEDVGWIEEYRYQFYHADGDLCLKLWQRGYEVVDCPRAFVEHFRHANAKIRKHNMQKQKADWSAYLDKYNIPEGYLFYPSQFWPHKNHVGLLMATKLLKEKYDLVLPVVFVGSDMGNLHHVRKMVDELGLSSQVHFLGFVFREDLVGLYRNALALAYLTFFGPENLPPLEAFGLGCPVIASKVSGAEEQLGDAALLVDPKDEEQIAMAIKKLLDDESLRDSLISRGMARVRKWTAEDFVQSVLSIIDEFEPFRRCWD